MTIEPKPIKLLETNNGVAPFEAWYRKLRDQEARQRIRNRVDRLEYGNLGDHKFLGQDVYELRIDYGPGYRVYCALYEQMIYVLLLGGDKTSQSADIARAKALWTEYKHEAERFQRDF